MTFMNRVALGAFGLALSLVSGTALADVVVVVSAKSPITALSKSQVADLFSGRTRLFPNGLLAVPIDQADGSITRDEFYTAQIKAYWSKIIFTGRGQPPKTVSSSAEVKKRLLENPAAIGYIEDKMVDDSVRVLP
jgi:ABC-type phosphate transport system substrate-binding protein